MGSLGKGSLQQNFCKFSAEYPQTFRGISALSWRKKTVVLQILGPATTQNLVVKFDGEICGGVLVENASDDFPQQKKLEDLLPNFAGSSPPISPKTSPTSLWKSLVLNISANFPRSFRKPLRKNPFANDPIIG